MKDIIIDNELYVNYGTDNVGCYIKAERLPKIIKSNKPIPYFVFLNKKL